MSKVTVDQILKVIKKSNVVTDVGAIDQAKPLQDQGVDSLDISGILFNMEEAFGIEIPDADIDGLQTINDILDYVNSKV